MSLFGRILENIGNQITITDKERIEGTKNYDIIRDHILNAMKYVDVIFKHLFGGTSLFGSYSNNVRINYCNEFDVIFKLEIPYSQYINVEQDEYRPGFVRLDFKDVLDKLEISNIKMYNFLNEEVLDWDNNFLRRGNLQRWLEDIITKVFHKFGNTVRGYNGIEFILEYSKRGLAHTIYAHCPSNKNRELSIDFIPAITFGQTKWMDCHSNVYPFTYKCNEWFAIPRPTSGPKFYRKYAFMICNPNVEHDLLLKKENLKVVFRLLKSLIKKYRMKRLKSYFITTAFLWEIKNQDIDFWFNSVEYLFIHMLDILGDYFEDGNLPFFWDTNLNLLDVLSDEEIEENQTKLFKAYNTLSSYHHQPKLTYARVARHFLIR